MKNAASSTAPSLASLIHYQDVHKSFAAASANYNLDEINRLRTKYATLLDLYHKVQMVETEGLLTVTVNSLTTTATVALQQADLFMFIIEPLLSQLTALEGQILAMLEDLPNANEEAGGPTPELNAISALCMPQPQAVAPSAPLCPFLPETMPSARSKRPVAATT